MVRRALLPGALAVVVAFAFGALVADPAVGASAALGAVVVLANFAAHGLSLAWASTVSVPAVQVVALGGFAVRLGAIVALLFLLDTMAWFSPLAFGLTVVPGTLLLLVLEALLVWRGRLGTGLDLPADPAAVRAAERLAAREAHQ